MSSVLRRVVIRAVVFTSLVLIVACASVSRQFNKVVDFIDGQDRIEMEGSTATVGALVLEGKDVMANSLDAPAASTKATTKATPSEKRAVKAQPAPTPLTHAKPMASKTPVARVASTAKQDVAKRDKPSTEATSVRVKHNTATLSGQVLVKAEAKTKNEKMNKSLVRLIPREQHMRELMSPSRERDDSTSNASTIQNANFIVDMRDKEYQPRYLTAKKDDTVIFTNSDKIRHNVFSRSGKNAFDLGTYAQGKQRGVTFKEPGIVKVYCNIHPNMATFVSVIDEGFSTTTDEDGRFTFEGLPLGEYTIEAWNIRGSVDTTVDIDRSYNNYVELVVNVLDPEFLEHSNKFGEKYPDKPVLFGDEFY